MDTTGKRVANELRRRADVTGETWKSKPPFEWLSEKAASDEMICRAASGRTSPSSRCSRSTPPRPYALANHQLRAGHGRWHQDRQGGRWQDHRLQVGEGTADGLGEARGPGCQDQVPCRRGALGVNGLILDANGKRITNELGRREGEMWKTKPSFPLTLNKALLAPLALSWMRTGREGFASSAVASRRSACPRATRIK